MGYKSNTISYSEDLTPASEQKQFFSHVHTTYEMLFIYHGRGDFLIEDAEYPCKPNTLFLIPPGKYHVIRNIGGADYKRCVVNFSTRLLPRPIERGKSYYRVTDDRVRSLFYKLAFYSQTYTGEALQALLEAGITEILVSSFFENEENAEGKKVPALVKNAIDYINAHLEEPLSVPKIADALFISETHLSHLFSDTMNTGLMHYAAIKKMYAARERLREGASVGEVCERFGYRSYPTFLRNYRTHFGINPSEEKERRSKG
ncbi:MAG: helix-turn-helix domain-containing protein [Ruminococcaceae bacterium]|nr:helix-turn-helix domain-containing protein [Oscillospiraceae bacterium]